MGRERNIYIAIMRADARGECGFEGVSEGARTMSATTDLSKRMHALADAEKRLCGAGMIGRDDPVTMALAMAEGRTLNHD